LSSFGNDADDPTLNLMRGQIALRQGKYEEAVGYLRKAPASAQQDAKFLTDLAAGMMGSGDKAGAIEALTKAAALETESARPDVYLILAHVREKRYDKALAAVDNLAKDKPNDPVVHNLRASILLSQNKPEQARPHLLKALEINPGYYPAAYNLASLDLQKNDLQSARTRMHQVAKANPKESRAWIMLAQIDASAGKEAEALSHLEKAKNANEKDPQARLQLIQYWLRKNEPGKALVEARSALETTGRVEFNEFIGLAQAAQKDHTNARATFIKWAETQPKNPKAHFRLAQEWIKANDLGKALQSLDSALALHPGFVEAAASKAQLLGKMNKSAEGIRIAKELQEKYPKSSVGYLAQADILYTQKQYAAAAPIFAKASSLDGQTSSVLRAAQAYTLADQADTAQTLLGQWLSSHPQDVYARHEYALSLLNARQFPQAVAQYRQIVRDHPADVTAYNNLAWLLGELKDKDAVPVAERALKLNPESPALQDTLGWILVNTGQVSRGLPLLEKAHAKQPTATEIHWHYAYALLQAGKTAQAKRELEKLIFSDRPFPQKAEAKALLDRL
jgi:putative PEP-CTERM system TPR-repeat lipoprotein